MEIIIDKVKVRTLEEFADEHGLAMEVKERGRQFVGNGVERYYASLVTLKNHWSIDVVTPGFLTTLSGDGDTPELAIQDYGRKISECTVRIEGRDVEVPRIVEAADAQK